MPGTRTVEASDPTKIVQFTEDDHKYVARNRSDGSEIGVLTSVTSLIGEYFPKFDTDTIAPRVALKRGIPVEDVLAEWRRASEAASTYGTRVHEFMEDILSGRRPRNHPENPKEEAAFRFGLTIAKKLRPTMTDIECEKMICDIPLGLAGTIDLFAKNPRGGYFIYDWKTNKKIDRVNSFGQHGLPPIEHVEDCEFGHYTLQLNLYEFLLKHAGYIPANERVEKFLVHIHHELGPTILSVPDRQQDVVNLLKDYLTKKALKKSIIENHV